MLKLLSISKVLLLVHNVAIACAFSIILMTIVSFIPAINNIHNQKNDEAFCTNYVNVRQNDLVKIIDEQNINSLDLCNTGSMYVYHYGTPDIKTVKLYKQCKAGCLSGNIFADECPKLYLNPPPVQDDCPEVMIEIYVWVGFVSTITIVMASLIILLTSVAGCLKAVINVNKRIKRENENNASKKVIPMCKETPGYKKIPEYKEIPGYKKIPDDDMKIPHIITV